LGRQNPETFACANTQRIFNVEFALNAWPGEFQLTELNLGAESKLTLRFKFSDLATNTTS